MSIERARPSAGRPRASAWLDRVLAAVPVATLALVVLVFYAVEAWTRKTPWIFTDEVEWTQISRSIAATGHAARRGQPIFFKSLYAFLIAPFWWIRSTISAYAAIKDANVVIMTLTAVPTYLLARMLVGRTPAIVAATLSVAVPAMAYVTTIIVEVLAYPYYALCSWLAVRAFSSGRRRDLALAAIAAVGGLLVRSPQFFTIPLAFGLAALGLRLTRPDVRARWSGWTRGDRLGVILLVLGALFVFNRVVLQHISQWQFTSEYVKGRMLDLGLRAALSLTIGLGLLPVICGLGSLHLPERRGDRAYRAFVAWFAATIFALGLYTATKAAYLSTVFATLWEERNLIYLSPLMLIGTVLVFESRRIDWRWIAGATAFVVAMLTTTAFQTGWPYFEAPGFAIPAIVSRYELWSVHTERLALLGVLVFSLLLLIGRRRRVLRLLALVLGLAWLLSGEIANTVGIDQVASAFRANLPTPLNWVDVASHGQSVTYLGQAVQDPNGELLTEFWNRSIEHVDSLDGTAPGPGPTYRPLVVDSVGLLSGIQGHYVLADAGVTLAAEAVARQGKMVLYYSPSGRWSLLDNLEQEYADGWCPDFCAWTYFKPGQRGTLEVTLSRTAYNGSWPAGKVLLEVGTVGITAKNIPDLRRVLYRVHTLVHNGTERTLDFPVASTPVRVEIHIANPIPPSPSDQRSLGAQIGFRFVPAPASRRAPGPAARIRRSGAR